MTRVPSRGAEISFELAGMHPTWLAGGRRVPEVPVPHGSIRFRFFVRVVRFLGHHVLTMRTPVGRKVGPKIAAGATPLIRLKSKHLAAAGIERVPRVVGVRDGLPLLENGRVLEVENVVWCTGFRQDFSWIDLPIFGEDGRPVHDRGIVSRVPGMYFVGLHFLYAMTSATLLGVGRDAERIVKVIHKRGLVRVNYEAMPVDAAAIA